VTSERWAACLTCRKAGTASGEWFEQPGEITPDEVCLTGGHQMVIVLGHPAVSIGMLWEAMRWLDGTTTAEPTRLNDHYRSRYVRMLIDKHPEWEARFRVRELRAV